MTSCFDALKEADFKMRAGSKLSKVIFAAFSMMIILFACVACAAKETSNKEYEAKNDNQDVYDRYAKYRCTEDWCSDLPPEERPIAIPANEYEEFLEEFPELNSLVQ